ncbi:MAG: hypothetical protein VX526_03065 [Actinomycetota bacterium]|nr:hypothetical protein [Actinomycetota bacterium]
MTTSSESEPVSTAAPVAGGPRWYRRRIRVVGPCAALVPPSVIGVLSLFILLLGEGQLSAVVGLIGTMISSPGLLLVGAPIANSSSYPMAVLLSALFWIAVGFIAAWRATRRPIAGWPEFWREYVFLWLATATGAGTGIVIAATRIGSALL